MIKQSTSKTLKNFISRPGSFIRFISVRMCLAGLEGRPDVGETLIKIFQELKREIKLQGKIV